MKMNSDEFRIYCQLLQINADSLKCDLESLNRVSERQLHFIHYSTIPLQCYPRMELKLEWSEIFRRLVVEKRGGVCYERDEVLYQALKYIGFEVYRIECMAIKGFQRLSSRHDHMAVMVKLDQKWYLVDAGWGGVMFHGAMELTSGKHYECATGIWRPVGHYGEEKSPLDSSLPFIWDIELKSCPVTYPDYENFTKKDGNSWTPIFQLRFCAQELSDFSKQVKKTFDMLEFKQYPKFNTYF